MQTQTLKQQSNALTIVDRQYNREVRTSKSNIFAKVLGEISHELFNAANANDRRQFS